MDHKCDYCNKKYYSVSTLNRHKKTEHAEVNYDPKKSKICSIEGCGSKLSSMAELINHLQTRHQLSLMDYSISFKNKEGEFL